MHSHNIHIHKHIYIFTYIPILFQGQRYNSKTDIWSLGVILYEMVCLKMPFNGNNMRQLVQAIVNTTPSPPSTTYSTSLRELVKDILLKDPKRRPGINNILNRQIVKDRITIGRRINSFVLSNTRPFM
ncbi:hypothetical protein EON63_20860 [archaeon]|nr:MAG: hypothetical protein EON63_20860 [archaeon]